MQTRKTDVEGWEMGAVAAAEHPVSPHTLIVLRIADFVSLSARNFRREIPFLSYPSDKAGAFLDDIIKIGYSAVKYCLACTFTHMRGISGHILPSRRALRPAACVRKLRARIKLYLRFNYRTRQVFVSYEVKNFWSTARLSRAL